MGRALTVDLHDEKIFANRVKYPPDRFDDFFRCVDNLIVSTTRGHDTHDFF